MWSQTGRIWYCEFGYLYLGMKTKSLAAILLLITVICSGQDFDRQLEKSIKTEVNMNRIAKSQNPLDLSSFYKKLADSINMMAAKSYLDNAQVTSKGVREDWEKIWAPVQDKLDLTPDHANYNVIYISDGDYKTKLREKLFDKTIFFYKLENSSISLSVIKADSKIFLTTITW